MSILGFRGQYRFLSNFYRCDVTYRELTYKSSEAAYQAQKCPNTEDMSMFTRISPSDAKRLGFKMKCRSDWDSIKYMVMKKILYCKFTQNQNLCSKLIDTNGLLIEEVNDWGDTYWGICNGKGLNKLGLLLMELRYELTTRGL